MDQKINTVEDFGNFVKVVEGREGYRRPQAFGIGIAHVSSAGNILDTRFPFPNFENNFGTAAVFANVVGHLSGTETYELSLLQLKVILECFAPFLDDGKHHGNIEAVSRMHAIHCIHPDLTSWQKKIVVSFIDAAEYDTGPQTLSDAYLRLHLLSHRLVKPNGIKLNDIFSRLPNNAWTNKGPVAPEDLPDLQQNALIYGTSLQVHSVDRFPRMTDYVVPTDVRIADASRVRLGAYLGEGTTVMHEGFVNFNAGTLGKSMVEGRISAGVVVGDKSDIGGGASIMGTLSGGGTEKITIGRGCLLGANAGTGISLGDLCVIEAGLYVTAGMPVLYRGAVVKAKKLSGQNGLTFRRNSQIGLVEVLDRPNTVVLNEVLHKN